LRRRLLAHTRVQMNSPEAVLLIGLGLVVYAVYRGVSALGRRKAASARYLKMQPICAVHGGAPGPVDMPGVFNLAGVGFLFGLSNQFTNAADLSSREEKRTLFFTLVTARFPGVDMPHVTVTRKGLPGTPSSRRGSLSRPMTGDWRSCSSTCR
jgi:hypothetical protein